MKYKRFFTLVLSLFAITLSTLHGETEARSVEIPTQAAPVAIPQKPHTAPDFDPFALPAEEPKENDNPFFAEFLKMMANLGLLIALLLIASWFIKRLFKTRVTQMNDRSHIKIIDQRSMSAKSAIYLIEAKGRGFILAESHAGITRIGEYSLDNSDSSFGSMLDDPNSKKTTEPS